MRLERSAWFTRMRLSDQLSTCLALLEFVTWSRRLSDATPAQRANWELTGDGYGVHWPDVDEDISAEGMLSGVAAPRPRKAVSRLTRPAQKRSTAVRSQASRAPRRRR
jgi:Protein of unknown function (DUF2442)